MHAVGGPFSTKSDKKKVHNNQNTIKGEQIRMQRQVQNGWCRAASAIVAGYSPYEFARPFAYSIDVE